VYNPPDSAIQNYLASHQKYFYTEYSYSSDNPHQVFYTAVQDTNWHKWLFQQYRLDDVAIKITNIDSSNSLELSWTVQNQQDEVEIWVKSNIKWVLIAKSRFSDNKFKLAPTLENQNITAVIVRIVVLNHEGFVYGIDEQGTSYQNPTFLIKRYLAPDNYSLSQNYPNPFNQITTISFSLPIRSFVSLKVFDLAGREVSSLIFEELPAGEYTRQWNAAGFPSGVYLYRLQSGSVTLTKKLVLLK